MTPKAILILLSIELLIIYIIMSYKIYKLKEQHLKTLQELVDKATPKKPDKVIDDFCDDTWEYYFCPNCEKEVECENAVDDTPYCPFCGQALKWSEQ
jgi:transcription initiation factor IIE alpha subunit